MFNILFCITRMEESKKIIKSCWETKMLINKTVNLFIQTKVQRTGNASGL